MDMQAVAVAGRRVLASLQEGAPRRAQVRTGAPKSVRERPEAPALECKGPRMLGGRRGLEEDNENKQLIIQGFRD